MNRLKLFAAFSLLSIQAVEASAETLDITGKYGNAAGCKFMATSEIAEDMVFLTQDGWGTYATLCSFVEVLKAGDFTRVVTAICAHEGEDTQTIDMLRLEKNREGVDAWTAFNSAGDDWGTVSLCRP
jgi:hypothetical protein